MAERNNQNVDMSGGEWGGGNDAFAGLHGMSLPSTPGSIEEIEHPGPLGEDDGNTVTSNLILPERGELTGEENVAVRQLLDIISRRLSILLGMYSGAREEDEDEILDRIEACRYSRNAVDREFFLY